MEVAVEGGRCDRAHYRDSISLRILDQGHYIPHLANGQHRDNRCTVSTAKALSRFRKSGELRPMELRDERTQPLEAAGEVVVRQAKADPQMVIEAKVIPRNNEHAGLMNHAVDQI